MRSASATAERTACFAFGQIDHRAGLDAARLDLAVTDQFDGMGPPAQGVARRARLQPRDHAGNLAGADIGATPPARCASAASGGSLGSDGGQGRSCVTGLLLRLLVLNSSSRALAASSDNCTVSRSGRRMSTATISRENSRPPCRAWSTSPARCRHRFPAAGYRDRP